MFASILVGFLFNFLESYPFYFLAIFQKKTNGTFFFADQVLFPSVYIFDHFILDC